MQVEIGKCNKCTLRKSIANKRHGLCNECNWKRLHPGASLEAHKAKQQRSLTTNASLKRGALKSQKKRLKSVSTRKAKGLRRKSEAYSWMRKNLEHVCTGCGTHQNLSHSHLIPIGYGDAFEGEIENITYHCLTVGERVGCHDIWEKGSQDQLRAMNDYEQSMSRVKKLDSTYYQIMLNRP